MSHEPSWLVDIRTADAATLHLDWPPPDRRHRRAVALCRVTGRPAVVLGSAQSSDVADPDAVVAAGVDVVRRRSGGGAVLVAPGAQVWVEAWVPRHDPLWDDDIVRAPYFFGLRWSEALSAAGLPSATLQVHAGRLRQTPWSALVCFSGVGPGEVTVGGRKLVGLSQRRTRAGGRISTMALVHWDPAGLAPLLSLDPKRRAEMVATTTPLACGLGDVLPGAAGVELVDRVESALLASFGASER